MTLRAILPSRPDWQPALRAPGADLLAGLMVALVALPLALGFGISSGLGAAAGLATAVVAGVVAAVFGGSRFQVSGPTGGMTVVLVPIVAQYGTSGVLTVGMMAGLVLVVLALARVGRAVHYIPAPVVEGFTVGIAVVIALQQFPLALGITQTEGDKVWQTAFDAVRQFVSHPHPSPILTTLLVGTVVLAGGRFLPKLPLALIAVVGATVVAHTCGLDLAPIGAIPTGSTVPTIGFVHLDQLGSLIGPALAVAALAGLQSLLSATAADSMAVGTRHDPDRELFGQGLANIAAPMFGGVPAAGAIARTAVNIRSGARTRLAALVHALVLAAIMYAAADLVAEIPLAALAGVLLATTARMAETASVTAIVRASRGDAAIMAVTFGVTVMMDLVTAVAIGVGIAVVLALRAVAKEARLQQIPLDLQSNDADATEEHQLLRRHIVAYRIEGPLFFAAAHRFLLELAEVSDVRVVILRMSHITALDSTGALVLKDAITKLGNHHVAVLMSGLRDDHRRRLAAVGALPPGGDAQIFEHTPDAISHAHLLTSTERHT